MTESLEEWLDRFVREEDAHSHRVLSTAKLVTTFAAATAATFVATALQVGGKPQWSDWMAVAAMVVALALVVVIVFGRREAPRLVAGEAYPDPDSVSPGDQKLKEFRKTVREAATKTKERADCVLVLTVWQLGFCIVAIAFAVLNIHQYGG